MSLGRLHLSVRTRTVGAIVLTAVVIISFAIVTGIFFVERTVQRAIETDLSMVADVADHFVSSEIRLMKSRAAMAALRIEAGEPPASQLAAFPEFTALAVFDREGNLVESAGKYPAGVELLGEAWMGRVFAGESILSTTMVNTAGEVVVYLATPLGEGALAITLDGMILSDMLSGFTIWQTGHIYLNDAEGYVIANIRPAWVRNRFNFITMARENDQYENLARVVRRMIRGETGIARFSVAGAPRIAAFRPVSGSGMGWSLGAVGPLRESPAHNIHAGLLMVGLICFFLSVMAALVAAGFIVQPYHEAARLKDLAEAASKAKSSFLARMSHEMRTPLNAVIGLSELTLGGEIAGEDRSNIEKVYNSGLTLLGIVNDILDLSKIESGNFELVPVEYSLPSLVNDTATLNLIRAGSKPVKFGLHLDKALPSRLLGDDLRVKQIFNNLLSNAFKYTREGTVDWSLSASREGDWVWLTGTVRDSGIGIRPEDLNRLFTDYSQIDLRNNRAIEGTGLGLSITKGMVEMMGGAITVESEYGKGSVFTVRLRQQFVDEGTIGEETARNLAAFRYVDTKLSHNNKMFRISLPYARVLVVDDVASNLDVARGILKPYGMRVDCASSGAQAVEMVKNGEARYNAIFMDHMMPGMDGIEAVRIIREEIGTEYARTVPIIALTANALIGNEAMFLEKGFQEFLSKPIDIMAMDTAIRRWVRDRSLENGTDLSGPGIPVPEEDASLFDGVELPGLDIAEGLKRFSGNGASYLEVLESYVKNTPTVLEELRMLRGGDLPGYEIAVHGLKGASRGIGAAGLGETAARLEQAAREGKFDQVSLYNGPFIAEVEAFLRSLSGLLEKIGAKQRRPRKDAPDPAALAALREASESFNIEGVDRAMEELKAYTYDQGADLVEWLNERVMVSAFGEIVARLSQGEGVS